MLGPGRIRSRHTNLAHAAKANASGRAGRFRSIRAGAAWPRCCSRPLVEPLAQLLAGLEKRNVLFADLDALAGARIAPHPCTASFDRKRAKSAQLDAVAARQRRRDLVKNGGNDALDVALVEVRVALGQPLNQFGFGHCAAQAPRRVKALETLPNPTRAVKKRSTGRRPGFSRRTSRPFRSSGSAPRRECRRGWRRNRTSRIPPSPVCPRRSRAP